MPAIAHEHYQLALRSVERLRRHLRHNASITVLRLLDELPEQIGQAYWRAGLRQRVSRESVAATPFCRRLVPGPYAKHHLEELRRGMLAAELSLTGKGPYPWNSLIYGRRQFAQGFARHSFECGFLMRMYQLLHEYAAHAPQLTPGD